jgi:hypothetical protein
VIAVVAYMGSKQASAPFSPIKPVAENEYAVDEATLAFVGKLRVLHRFSRMTRRSDFDHACSLIAGDNETSAERYAAAFFHGAQLFALRPLKFFSESARTVSADEMWLARLLTALHGEDFVSARYLMALRMENAGLRRMLFLAGGLASALLGKLSPKSGV